MQVCHTSMRSMHANTVNTCRQPVRISVSQLYNRKFRCSSTDPEGTFSGPNDPHPVDHFALHVHGKKGTRIIQGVHITFYWNAAFLKAYTRIYIF